MFVTRISAFAKGTLVNFKTQWRAYLLFCNYFHLEPFDIDSELLCTYSEFLSRSFRSAQSIRNYLNGVKVLFLLLGLHVDVFSSYELKLTMKGLDRKLKHLPKQAFPITLEILGKIREHLNLNTPLDATYWCLFLFALLLLSRKSNLVPVSTKKFDKNKQLCRGDVTVFPSLIIVAFKWTKTIQLDFRSTLVCDSIAKHVKTVRRCHLQAFPGANIWDMINLLNCGTIQVNYDIILIHVGTNNVGTYEIADFDIGYNVLISTIEKLVKPHTVIVMSAIIPRLLDFQNTSYFVTTINSRLRSLCFKRGVQFVATYKPFLKFGMPVCELYSPICKLHLNYFGNLKLTNFFVQVLSHC
ncbi:uncharacterized protein LOC134708169 [Mytilus trossulus]|uniref:uncharacterized protein LOC134708169 n=1 Tax=Mytilus trossulus TaxID=6551 RepID=UPI0030058AFF